MRLKGAVILLAVLPLVLASAAVAWMVKQRSQVLADMHLAAVQPVLLAARKAELQSYVNLGRSSIAHLVRDGMPDARAQEQALAILKRLEYSHDGYFFVFDFRGNNLLYPRQPDLQGRNLLELRDRLGAYPIRKLLDQARAGGGYVEYEWTRPSTGRQEKKLGYVEPIAGWEWMLGTGTYVDEPAQARRRIAEATGDAIVDTLSRIGAIALLSTVAVVALALVINLNEQRKADAKLRAMAREIVRSQEAERARLARELHDGVSQWLVSVKYIFESAAERARNGGSFAEVTAALDAGVVRLREVLGEVRRISHDLRPALLDDLGLARALEHLAREWSARSGIAVQTHCAAGAAHDAVPETVATALFRVAQEALGNVERHAAAREARITLQPTASGGLRFEVADDGQGFDADAMLRSPREGLGLTHMRERVESLGGRFELRSNAAGTIVGVDFPATALSS
ncbi:MAG TPA: cache domain-containing protein [Burkholderiaceae bacterium]|nr:cache domain-containing protein [Burkholderiaceae bacterium]